MPSTTTVLSKTSVIAPAPRVVYHRTELDTCQRDEPETTVPVPEPADPIPVEGWSDESLELDEELLELDVELVELDVLLELEDEV